MIATKSPRTISRKIPVNSIPKALIHEIIDGKPYYKKGYKTVLNNQRNIDDIMGASSLHVFILNYLAKVLMLNIDDTKYLVLTGEVGIHLDKGSNLSGDLVIYDTNVLSIDKINEHYADVPPKISIEIDISIEIEAFSEDEYIFNKTQKLLAFGTEKVIWIFSRSKKVIIATPNADWQIKDWNKDVEVFDGIVLNIGKYLAEKGSAFA